MTVLVEAARIVPAAGGAAVAVTVDPRLVNADWVPAKLVASACR